MHAVVLLSDLLSESRIKIPLESSTKEDLLRELVQVLDGNGCVTDVDRVLDSVRARERLMTTGIGNGIAIPHGKSSGCGELAIAAGVAAGPVEFDALDGEPVRLFFLLVAPAEETGIHIKVLSRIARLIRQPGLPAKLMEAGDSEEFLETLRAAEAG